MKREGRKKGDPKKVERTKRVPLRGERRFKRAYENKLRRVNRDRAKSGKPTLFYLEGYDPATGKPE